VGVAGEFEWLKHALPKEFVEQVAWRENEVFDNGRAKPFDARDIIALISMFNIALFPNSYAGADAVAAADKNHHPISAYERKWAVLRDYERDVRGGAASYIKLAPLVADILRLYDIIRFTGRDLYNGTGWEGGAGPQDR
jgi:hypothetical protein